MRIALVSDVHANLDALNAVVPLLKDMDVVIGLGDYVGYYDKPNEVCEVMRDLNAVCVIGNHDSYAVSEALVDDPENKYRVSWTRQVLSAENKKWLKSLPVSQTFVWGELRVVATHASPQSAATYVYPDFAGMDQLLAQVEGILALGHTHIPMDVAGDGRRIVNPGSVGQPRDYDPRAAFAVLDTAMSTVEFHRVAYDHAAMSRRLAAAGWASKAIAILGRC